MNCKPGTMGDKADCSGIRQRKKQKLPDPEKSHSAEGTLVVIGQTTAKKPKHNTKGSAKARKWKALLRMFAETKA